MASRRKLRKAIHALCYFAAQDVGQYPSANSGRFVLGYCHTPTPPLHIVWGHSDNAITVCNFCLRYVEDSLGCDYRMVKHPTLNMWTVGPDPDYVEEPISPAMLEWARSKGLICE